MKRSTYKERHYVNERERGAGFPLRSGSGMSCARTLTAADESGGGGGKATTGVGGLLLSSKGLVDFLSTGRWNGVVGAAAGAIAVANKNA
jgi:hypothetical protein